MKNLVSTLLILPVLLLIACGAEKSPNSTDLIDEEQLKGSISGYVYNYCGEPLEDAELTVFEVNGSMSSGVTSSTFRDGSFNLPNINQGRYEVDLDLDGYYSKNILEVEIAEDQDLSLDTIYLAKEYSIENNKCSTPIEYIPLEIGTIIGNPESDTLYIPVGLSLLNENTFDSKIVVFGSESELYDIDLKRVQNHRVYDGAMRASVFIFEDNFTLTKNDSIINAYNEVLIGNREVDIFTTGDIHVPSTSFQADSIFIGANSNLGFSSLLSSYVEFSDNTSLENARGNGNFNIGNTSNLIFSYHHISNKYLFKDTKPFLYVGDSTQINFDVLVIDIEGQFESTISLGHSTHIQINNLILYNEIESSDFFNLKESSTFTVDTLLVNGQTKITDPTEIRAILKII